MKTILEPEKNVPVLGEYDVVVCGAGPAGCAAAVSAARLGAKTVLVEREGYAGGAPCTQLVNVILSTNGVDFQGIWHEWAAHLEQYGGITPLWRELRCGTVWISGGVDPEAVKLVWDGMLDRSGAEVFYITHAAGAVVRDGFATGVLVETRAGRCAVMGSRVIDCTGDGIIAAEAGVPWESGAAGRPWAMGVSLNALRAGMDSAVDETGMVHPKKHGKPAGGKPLFQSGLLRLLEIDPLDTRHLTRVMKEGRAYRWDQIRELWKKQGYEHAYMAMTAPLPGVRSSRRIRGIATVTRDDAWNLTKSPESIARSSWEIDIHPADRPEGKAVAHDDPAYVPRIRKTEKGDWFDIPYGCIVAAGVDNLLMAGRCISAEHEAQASLRIQQTCMSTGQAAGTAAALSLKENTAPRELDPGIVIRQLEKDRNSVKLFIENIKSLPLL